MSIQSSFNQLLNTAAAGVGLYAATSPAHQAKVQRQRDEAKALREEEKIAEEKKAAYENLDIEDIRKAREKEIALAEKYPSEKRLEKKYKAKEAIESEEEMEKRVYEQFTNLLEENQARKQQEKITAEINALETQKQLAEQFRSQQESLKFREDFLKAGRDTIPTSYTKKEG